MHPPALLHRQKTWSDRPDEGSSPWLHTIEHPRQR